MDTQLDSPEWRVSPRGSTMPASLDALRRGDVAVVEPSGSALTRSRGLSLMSDSVPPTPRRWEEEDPPIVPSSLSQLLAAHQVGAVAIVEVDTDTLVSESSRRGDDVMGVGTRALCQQQVALHRTAGVRQPHLPDASLQFSEKKKRPNPTAKRLSSPRSLPLCTFEVVPKFGGFTSVHVT